MLSFSFEILNAQKDKFTNPTLVKPIMFLLVGHMINYASPILPKVILCLLYFICSIIETFML